MQSRQKTIFTTIRTEGSILPADLLQRVEKGDSQLGGLSSDDYHLSGNEKLNEAISRSWNRLLGAWTHFKGALEKSPTNDPATTLTRDRWLLPLFQELGYGRLMVARAIELEGKSYPISHGWQHAPIHLVGAGVDIDTRTAGVAGAARVSPHSLVQEFLNRSGEHLWGFVSNGKQLRVLRDNVSLTRQAFVQFDLEAMMTGEVYSDFALLWLLCHQSRVEADKPTDCWLEHWSRAAQDQGTRALDQLRNGVEAAIEALGTGFLLQSANKSLLQSLRSGQLTAQDYYRQVLRLVYRLLFLFVAEDRELLLLPDANTPARERYTRFYSLSRLRHLAERRVGTRHTDLFQVLRLIMDKLGDEGCTELGLPALGSFLFSKKALTDLEHCEISNSDLLNAIRALAFMIDRQGRRLVDYRNLRSEELGSVYEALLELHPVLNSDAGTFELETVSGSERKTTGSYYTPESLVQCLLDSALDPVLDEAAKKAEPDEAILKLKICDPACGSGHFLIAAAHRIAKRLAAIRTGDAEASPEALRKALRDVIGHCVYGVDVNPMAVELCKVSLWMEALEPGKPLSFLDQRIQVGNSLLGATPALLRAGIPDDAFKPIEGDDKAVCSKYKKLNKEERLGFRRLFKEDMAPWERLGDLATELAQLDEIPDTDIEAIRRREERYEQYVRSGTYLFSRLWADAWCAAFVWNKTTAFDYPITEEEFRKIERNPHGVSRWMRDEIKRLARQYQFFHWYLAFPDVFHVVKKGGEPQNKQAGWNGGFDVVLGNPPWERIKLQEKEWFATRRPDIANAPNQAARRKMIDSLAEDDPPLLAAFLDDRRKAEGESHLVRNGGRYPLCGRGDINTYAIFAETNRWVLGSTGRVGCVVPSGIATDDTTRFFFADLMETGSLVSLYDFENAVGMFPGVGHGRFKFCLLTLSGSDRPGKGSADFVFFAHRTDDLREDDRHFTLSAEDLALLNPNTRTCPVFRSKRDAELTKSIYRREPVLIKEGDAKNGIPEENPWRIRFSTMFHMANDSSLFRTRQQLESGDWRLDGNIFFKDEQIYLPLYEAKMFHHFDHRFGDYSDYPEGAQSTSLPDVPVSRLQDAKYVVQPRYWVPYREVVYRISRVPEGLIKFYRANDEETIGHTLTVWLAGYYLNRGNEDIGNTLLSEAYGNAVTAYGAQDQLLAATWLEQEFPLSQDEVFSITRVQTTERTFVEVAWELIESRCPSWLVAFRDIARSTDERTAIFSVIPRVGVGNTSPLVQVTSRKLADAGLIIANLDSFAADYAVRQKIGGTHLTFSYLKQFPVLPPQGYSAKTPWCQATALGTWLTQYVLELVHTSDDTKPFASDCGYLGLPFRWEPGRRFLLRCELDAAYFHLYGISRDDVDYMMDTFHIVKRDDHRAYREYRTKRTILEIYDEMQRAIETGEPYQTHLDPPPALGWVPSEEVLPVESESSERCLELGESDAANQFELRPAQKLQSRLHFDKKE